MTSRDAQREMQLTAMRLEAEGVVSLELRATDREPLPAWEPGAHIDLLLPSGRVRQYSLCGDPRDRQRLRVAVLREADGRGGSREVHDDLRVGQRLAIRGPRNAFAMAAGERYLFVAGGIGITPILAMVEAAERAGAEWQLVYGGRSRRSMAFRAALEALGGERVTIRPADEAGLLDLEAIVDQAAAGWDERLHLERFSPPAPSPSSAAENTGDTLRVILARSGGEVEVPADRSILEALRAAGHEVDSSCEQGVCGMCETRVLDGEPDHRDMLLTEEERKEGRVMMLCVSRACTPTLTLDL